MKFGGTTALLMAALTLAGCDNTPADLHGLPKDAAERATLCGRSAVAYAAAGNAAGAAETKRRQDLLLKIVQETGFASATGLDDKQNEALLGDIQATLAGGNWLGTLNQCKAAYALGDPEPLPKLPDAAKDRPAACAAVAVAASFGKGANDPAEIQKLVMGNPQSSYFLLIAANQAGGMAAAQNGMLKQIEWAITSGAVGPLTDACVKEYPKAGSTTAATLPADDGEAAAACSFSAELVAVLDGEEGNKAKALSKKMQSGKVPMDVTLATSPQKLIAQAVDLGTPANVVKACDARFK